MTEKDLLIQEQRAQIKKLENKIEELNKAPASIVKIAEYYGFENQCVQAMEELAELAQAISKEYRYGWKKNAVAEEIADVKIMLQQIMYFLEIDKEEIQKVMDAKIKRQLERIGAV